MRLDSILFVAGLSACINASSTHSISSSAKSIASHQEDVFADGIGVETINEERTLNIPGFDTVVENINLMASSRMVKMLDGKNQVVQVFRELNLQNNLLENPNLNLFYSFAGKFKHEKTEKTSLITAARAVYGDIPLGKMLEAAWRKSTDATATPLLIELFRQWNADTKSHQLDIDNKLEGDLQSSYKAYISAFVKAI
ncbi:unnamed protein product [Peronospora farinosa]|uniref:RxLR effector protein n=1 Tax=Peronospora farinosa TaxID=134698 RepID=A0ABN8BX36_9STRA|nr:unnamed protein product [Peronospora farinosa]